MSQNKSFVIVKYFALLALGLSGWARATTVVTLSPENLARQAPIVVHGRVVQMDVDGQTGFRSAIVEALDIPRAPEEFRQVRDFYIPLLNRAIPNRDEMEWVAGAPELKVGEELVLFLRPVPAESQGLHARIDGRPLFALQGFHQGKMRVVKDKRGVRRLAAWNEFPEKPVSPVEIRGQRTTTRIKESVSLLTVPSSELRSLDSLLNLARDGSR
jgi:hypothetical protein